MTYALRGSDEASLALSRQSRKFRLIWSLKRASASAQPFEPVAGAVSALTRLARPLSGFDKIGLVHDALRKAQDGVLCVLNGTQPDPQISGLLTIEELNRALADAPEALPNAVSMPLGSLLNACEQPLFLKDAPQLKLGDSLDAARSLFRERGDAPLIQVADEAGRYVGILLRSDFVAADLGNLAPVRVGGMATPLGVYLTDGVVQGGAGNLGLFLTGASITLLYVVAIAVTFYGLQIAESKFHFDLVHAISMLFLRLNPAYVRVFADDLQGVAAMPVLFLLLRLVPIAGYHAAEHQVVHCIERGEPLSPETVRRMPRAHPRCGTNIVAGIGLFSIAMAVMFGMTSSILQSVVPSLVFTLFLWRPVGTFLQNYLTTRPASLKQIESGIRAGAQVIQRHSSGGIERRANLAQRLWNMGLAQILLGSMAVVLLLQLLVRLIPSLAVVVNQIS